jgi:hypothetical protein
MNWRKIMDKRKIESAHRALEQIAEKNNTTVEEVRKQIKIAMINGLVSDDPRQKAYWHSIPREGDIPTPEEFIAYTADVVRKMKIK